MVHHVGTDMLRWLALYDAAEELEVGEFLHLMDLQPVLDMPELNFRIYVVLVYTYRRRIHHNW